MLVAGESGRRRTSTALLAGSLLGIATVVAVFSAMAVSPPGGSSSAFPQGLHAFDSYSQMQQFVTANARSAQQYSQNGVWFGNGMPVMFGGVATTATMTVASTAASPKASAPSFTGTNVQVQGVDEPDRVKTDGMHLFVSSGNNVTLINAYPSNATSIASRLRFPNSTVVGLEIAKDRLLVIDQKIPYVPCCVYSGIASLVALPSTVSTSGAPASISLLLYDTSHISSPKLIANVSISGDFVAARLADGYLYAVIQQSAYTFSQSGNTTASLPAILDDGVKAVLAPTSVYYASNSSQVSYYTMIASVDMSTGSKKVVSVLTGPSSTVYVSPSNIYVVSTNYPDLFSTHGIIGDVYTGGTVSMYDVQQAQNSTIVRAAYSAGSITVAAAGVVPGSVLNQFSLDEYNGYFRVATGRFAFVGGYPTRSDDVYVLNMSMS